MSTLGDVLSEIFYPTPEAREEAKKKLRNMQSQNVWKAAWRYANENPSRAYHIAGAFAFADDALATYWTALAQPDTPKRWGEFFLDCFDAEKAMEAARAFADRFQETDIEA